MKRTFLPKRSVVQQLLTLSWGGGALLLVLIALCVRLVSPTAFYTVVRPVSGLGTILAQYERAVFGGFSDAARLTAENARLTRELDAARIENLALEQRVHGLAALLARAEGSSASSLGLLAAVVQRPPVAAYDTLVIAPGSDRGVVPYMEVFGVGGSPVGVVSEVWPGFARAVLFSAPAMKTTAWVGGAAVPVLMQGRGGGALEAVVARTAPISVGDTVYVPGPGMLPYGTVARIESDPTSPSVTVAIQPFNNPFTLNEVQLRVTGFDAAVFAVASTTP